jgi:hypothetical protein
MNDALVVWLTGVANLLEGQIDSHGVETVVLIVSNQKLVLIEGKGGIGSWAASGRIGEFSPPLGPRSHTIDAAVSALKTVLAIAHPRVR